MAEIRVMKPVRVKASSMKLTIPVHGRLTMRVFDDDGEEVFSNTGYPPRFIPSEDHGGTLALTIDIDTGTIVGWDKLVTPRMLELYIHEVREEERRKAIWDD